VLFNTLLHYTHEQVKGSSVSPTPHARQSPPQHSNGGAQHVAPSSQQVEPGAQTPVPQQTPPLGKTEQADPKEHV